MDLEQILNYAPLMVIALIYFIFSARSQAQRKNKEHEPARAPFAAQPHVKRVTSRGSFSASQKKKTLHEPVPKEAHRRKRSSRAQRLLSQSGGVRRALLIKEVLRKPFD
jgi:hypothetical protein